MRKLAPRFVLLMVMVGCLVILPADFAGKPVSASRFCCSECDFYYQQCTEGCTPGSGHFRCMQQCNNNLRDCQALCDPMCYDRR
jgi:hypothetical protein